VDAGGDETGATDAFGDETGAADVFGDAGAGDPVWAVGWGDAWATDAYGDAGRAEEVGDTAADFYGDFVSDYSGELNNVFTNSDTDFKTDFIGEDLLLNVDSFLVVDGSILLGATIGLIWLTGEGVDGALFEVFY